MTIEIFLLDSWKTATNFNYGYSGMAFKFENSNKVSPTKAQCFHRKAFRERAFNVYLIYEIYINILTSSYDTNYHHHHHHHHHRHYHHHGRYSYIYVCPS
uniref:Uncharacterized protein n=1 Tax=Glossina palpalis gambiensis TaxID=67801 RepID=A0A1B0ANU9_9MUSC